MKSYKILSIEWCHFLFSDPQPGFQGHARKCEYLKTVQLQIILSLNLQCNLPLTRCSSAIAESFVDSIGIRSERDIMFRPVCSGVIGSNVIDRKPAVGVENADDYTDVD